MTSIEPCGVAGGVADDRGQDGRRGRVVDDDERHLVGVLERAPTGVAGHAHRRRQLRRGHAEQALLALPRSGRPMPVFPMVIGTVVVAPKSTVSMISVGVDRGDRGVEREVDRELARHRRWSPGWRRLRTDPSRRSACSCRAAAGAGTCRSRRSSAARPPGWAVTVAPTIGEPSLASVTTPVAMPVGTTVMRVALFGVRVDFCMNPRLERVGAAGILDADGRVAAVTRVGRFQAVQEIDVAALPQLHLEVVRASRPRTP